MNRMCGIPRTPLPTRYPMIKPASRPADPVNDRISVQSPVGQALMGKTVGDKVEVRIPVGTAHYEILAIRPA